MMSMIGLRIHSTMVVGLIVDFLTNTINVDKMLPPERPYKYIPYTEKPIGRFGTWRLAQKIRRYLHYRDGRTHHVYKWAQRVITTEIQLCATSQREVFLKEEIGKLDMSSTEYDQKQLHKWAKELELLDKRFWRLERILYGAESRGEKGPAKDAYLSLRQKPGWHLKSKWLREDCAKRGGCCGRQCKCCENPPDSYRIKGWGHCTIECACCYRRRGFKLEDEKDQKLFQPKFDVSSLPMTEYSVSIFRAYIWALE